MDKKKMLLPITYDNVPKIVRTCDPYRRYFDIDLRCGRYIVDATSYLGVLSFCNHTVEVCPLIAALKDEIDEEKVAELYEELKPFGIYEED